MKLAIVHDWIKDISGAERVLVELHRMYPEAPIYTLFYDPKFTRQILPKAEIRASFLQKFPFILRKYSLYGWLMPAAIESFDLSDFDTVISSSATALRGCAGIGMQSMWERGILGLLEYFSTYLDGGTGRPPSGRPS